MSFRAVLLTAALACGSAIRLLEVKTNDADNFVDGDTSNETVGRIPRIVMWKRARTGSTWIADMLKREPTMKCFHHEIGCVANLKSWVKAPPCDCGCNSASKCTAAINGQSYGVGFSHNADHFPVMGEAQMSEIMLASEDVWPVHLIRTNFIRHALSYHRAEMLKSKCGSKKVKGSGMEKCAQSLPQTSTVNTTKFIAFAQNLAFEQRRRHEMIKRALKVGNKEDRLLTISYENMMKDAQGEVNRILKHVGLLQGAGFAKAVSKSVKITNKPLSAAISNFDELKKELQNGNHACLLKQLDMEDHEHFEGWC